MKTHYLFPLEHVEKDEKIIIYGAGPVGFSFVEQMLNGNHCTLLFVGDRKHAEIKDVFGVPVYGVDTILATQYDKIIISVTSYALADDIRKELICAGVENSKIFYNKYVTISDYDLEHRLLGPVFSRCLSKTITIASSIEYDTELSPLEKIRILRFLCEREIFNQQLMKMFVDTAFFIDDIALVYKCVHYILRQTFLKQEYEYDEIYLDLRRLWAHVATRLDIQLSFPTKKATAENGKKIAVIRDLVHIRPHEPGIAFPNHIVGQGYEATVFITGEERQIKGLNDELKKRVLPSVNFVFAEGETIREKTIYILNAIVQYNPWCIIQITSGQTPVSFWLYEQFPIINAATRGSFSPVFFHKLITSHRESALTENNKFKTFTEDQPIEIFRRKFAVAPKGTFKRSDYGINEDDFVLVTVGNRLEYDISEQFAKAMCSLLRNHPNVRWILVGRFANSVQMLEVYSDLIRTHKLILWGYERDLDGFYTMCNLYVNPNRCGGASSIRSALFMGVPATMTNYAFSDGFKVIGGEEYAIKGGYDELMAYISRLATDKNEYARKLEELALYVKTANTDLANKAIIDACKETVDAFYNKIISD